MTVLQTDKMIASKEGAIGWVIFNNPARRNAVSMPMWQALRAIVDDFSADPQVRVIVLKGAGDKAFVAGADISEFEEKRSNVETSRAYNEAVHAATTALREVRKPTIAMIRGYCVGGGVAVALACDLRIASDVSSFAIPAAKLGVGYEFEAVQKLVQVVGPSFAREIFYTARQFSAQEALAMGLVNRAVPDDSLEPLIREYASTIAGNAPLSVMSLKVLVAQALVDESDRDPNLCQKLVDRCQDSADYAEGRKAFMEKRKPKFTGR
jgi:enoyl-CoA hydratase